MYSPTEAHLMAIKRVLRYIKGTVMFGLFYEKGNHEELKAYNDSDFAGDINRGRSTSGYVLMSNPTVAWSSKKQPIVTLSTTEAEYVAASSCSCQSIWMNGIQPIELVHCGTKDQVADIMTKPLIKPGNFCATTENAWSLDNQGTN